MDATFPHLEKSKQDDNQYFLRCVVVYITRKYIQDIHRKNVAAVSGDEKVFEKKKTRQHGIFFFCLKDAYHITPKY